MDLMLGGDMKFHLINDFRFGEARSRFYAAEVIRDCGQGDCPRDVDAAGASWSGTLTQRRHHIQGPEAGKCAAGPKG